MCIFMGTSSHGITKSYIFSLLQCYPLLDITYILYYISIFDIFLSSDIIVIIIYYGLFILDMFTQ